MVFIPIETGNIALDIIANGGAGLVIGVIVAIYYLKKKPKDDNDVKK